MERESFKSRLGFLLVSAGCAIGIGNVWRFPFVVGQNGGGFFVLVYLVMLVVLGLPVLTMEKAIKAAAGKILEKVELFDVYKGSQIADGKKSVAFNITMRASDRTLTDEEVGSAMNKILKALEELGAQIRTA